MGVESLSSTDNRSHEDNREGVLSSNGIAGTHPLQKISLREAERICRAIAIGHYENFVVASALLPRKFRQPFFNIYAFCRTADDIADDSATPEIATAKLHEWQRKLGSCFEGQADEAIFIALADTARRFELTVQPFEQLLDAFLQDQVKTRYANFDELLRYCERSANPVGRIVLRLAGADTPSNVAFSDSICTGLQLANHWQDVARDLTSGRLYLPQEDLAKFGVDAKWLETSRTGSLDQSERFRSLIRFQCDRAEMYLRRGLPLAEAVPKWLANDVRLFVHGGLATLEAIAKINYDVLDQRPTVSKFRQLKLTAAAFFGCL
jgi:squalene synthase HpnC